MGETVQHLIEPSFLIYCTIPAAVGTEGPLVVKSLPPKGKAYGEAKPVASAAAASPAAVKACEEKPVAVAQLVEVKKRIETSTVESRLFLFAARLQKMVQNQDEQQARYGNNCFHQRPGKKCLFDG